MVRSVGKMLDTLTVQDAILIFTGVVAVMGFVWMILKFIYPLVRTFTRIRDAFLGKPAHNGFEAIPGIPERLGKVEDSVEETRASVATIDARLSTIEKHIVPNHGSTALLSENLQAVMEAQKELITMIERIENGAN